MPVTKREDGAVEGEGGGDAGNRTLHAFDDADEVSRFRRLIDPDEIARGGFQRGSLARCRTPRHRILPRIRMGARGQLPTPAGRLAGGRSRKQEAGPGWSESRGEGSSASSPPRRWRRRASPRGGVSDYDADWTVTAVPPAATG